jgi:photosystem II stability/assembly factor-like uncharacterized protein
VAGTGTILVGTVGQGILASRDDGDTWARVGIGQGMHSDALIRCLTLDRGQPGAVFAGSDRGLYRSDDAGVTWKLLDTPMNGKAVWVLSIDPADPSRMYAGTGTPNPAGLYRSEDGGKHWQQRPMEVAEDCPAVGVPRFTGIAIDPTNTQQIWAGLEVDGMRRSTDGGDSWSAAAPEISNPDFHSMLVTAGPPKTIFGVVNNEVWLSRDDGASWHAVGMRSVFPYQYPRTIAVRPDDPKTVYITIGDTTPGRIGTIMRSRDTGDSWEALTFPEQPNSAMWTVSMHPDRPDQMFAATRYGYLYRSNDGGDTWTKLWREFSEVSSVTWMPG